MPKFIRLVIKLIVYLGVPTVLLIFLLWNGYFLNVPSERQIQNFELAEATEIYTADSVLLGKMYVENRRSITFRKIPTRLVNCLIATEDNRY